MAPHLFEGAIDDLDHHTGCLLFRVQAETLRLKHVELGVCVNLSISMMESLTLIGILELKPTSHTQHTGDAVKAASPGLWGLA